MSTIQSELISYIFLINNVYYSLDVHANNFTDIEI